MTMNPEAENFTEVVLSPNFRIPALLLLGAGALLMVSWWVSNAIALRALALPIAILGLFLTIQTVLIRLQFTDQALKVLRSGKVILTFPYSEWLNWEIFWSPVPILFYFREVNSIHFLPIIFDAKALENCLQKYYPR